MSVCRLEEISFCKHSLPREQESIRTNGLVPANCGFGEGGFLLIADLRGKLTSSGRVLPLFGLDMANVTLI